MTNQHPLTDTICEELSCFPFEDCDEEGIMTDMRAAADWQLDQAIEWLKYNADVYMYEAHDGPCFDEDGLLDDLKKAMRPQEEIK